MRPQIPWPRIFAEGVAIIVSILLAFGIQAWWEGRQDRMEEEQLLAALSVEFAANREQLETNRASHVARQEAAAAILEAAAAPEITISRDSVDHLISDIMWYGTDGWVTGTMDALLSSGDLALIGNRSLQFSLTAWPRLRESLAAVEAEDEHGYEVLLPYLIRMGYLPQLYGATRGIPGTNQEVPHTDVRLPMVGGGVDHRVLLGEREFQNIVSMRFTNQTDYAKLFDDMDQLTGEISTLIESELAR